MSQELCKCVCHVSNNECCERCDNPLVKHLVDLFNEDLKLLREFYTSYGNRLSTIEDLFAGKSFKPIHDAMELHVERFDKRINSLENIVNSNKHLIEVIEKEGYPAQLDGLEERIADELAILKGFNDETQKGFNRLSERIEKLESDHLDQLNPHAFVILKKEIDEMKANVFFNKDNRHDLNLALRDIQYDYKRQIAEIERVFSGVDLEIQKDINENVKPKVNELWEMTGNGLRDLQKSIDTIESHIYSAGDISAIQGQLDNIQKNDLHNDHRIEMLEKTVSELVDKIAEIGNHYYREKQTPHKCPVCNADPEYITQGTYKCVSCEGKGVLWK